MLGSRWFSSSASHYAVLKGTPVGFAEAVAAWDDGFMVSSSSFATTGTRGFTSEGESEIEPVQKSVFDKGAVSSADVSPMVAATKPSESASFGLGMGPLGDVDGAAADKPVAAPPPPPPPDRKEETLHRYPPEDPSTAQGDNEELLGTVIRPESSLGSEFGEEGYLAAYAGDVLDDRYVLVKELGVGQSSRVWLARRVVAERKSAKDLKKRAAVAASPDKVKSGEQSAIKYVAIKIFRCEDNLVESMDYERRLGTYIQRRVASMTGKNAQRNGVGQLLDSFAVRGEFGVHPCLVFEVLGPQLDTIMQQFDYAGISDLNLLKSLVRSMLEGLSVLDDLHVVHTDLKPENMLLIEPSPEIKQLMEKDDVSDVAGAAASAAAQEAVAATADASITVTADAVKIVDFGLSYLVPTAQRPRKLTDEEKELLYMGNYTKGAVIQTREYRSPEIILGMDFNPKADVWSLGCVAFELATGAFLFDPKDNEFTEGDETLMDIEHLQEIIGLLGPPPMAIIKSGCYTANLFNKDGTLKEQIPAVPEEERTAAPASPHVGNPDAIEDLVYSKLGDKEGEVFVHFLRCCLSWDPQKRHSPVQLLRHKWLHNDPTSVAAMSGSFGNASQTSLASKGSSQDLKKKASGTALKAASSGSRLKS